VYPLAFKKKKGNTKEFARRSSSQLNRFRECLRATLLVKTKAKRRSAEVDSRHNPQHVEFREKY